MLITLKKRSRRRMLNDRGIALPMVLIVFFVSVALVSAFLVAIVGSSNVTSTNKSMVQAQAAAEAGIAVAEVNLRDSDPCEAGSFSSSLYDVKIECIDEEVMVKSTGTSESGLELTMERRYELSKERGGPLVNTTIYIARGVGAGGTLQGLNISTDLDPAPSIVIADGDFECGGSNFHIPGDIIVVDGDADFGSGNCQVRGDVYVSGNVKTGFGNIFGGDIHSNGNVTVESHLGSTGNRGNVYAAGDVVLDFHMEVQNIRAAGDVMARGIVFGSVQASGSIAVHSSATVYGTTTSGSPAPIIQVPTRSEVPKWVDYGFDMTDWTGYNLVTWNQTTCNSYKDSASLWQSLGNLTANTVIDARACADGLVTSWSNPRISLRADIALIMNKGTIRNTLTIQSASATPRTMYFITPDADTDLAGPQCPTNGGKIVFAATKVQAPAKVNIYTPCGITLQNANLRGGLFAEGVLMDWGSSFHNAIPFSVPGGSFDEWGIGEGEAEADNALGDLLLQRNTND